MRNDFVCTCKNTHPHKKMGVATSIIVILIHHRLVEVHVLDISHIVTERE